MKRRRILIIHESKVLQSIISRSLTAEVPEIDLHAVGSSKEAVEILDDEPFDMIISANEMEHLNGTDIYDFIMEGGRNKHAGFLLLTSELNEVNRELFKKKGISDVLKMPFKAGELAGYVEKLSSPRIWREHRRYSIPDMTVIIHTDKESIFGSLVNVSLGGMLCDTKVLEGIPRFSQYYQLEIKFPKEYGGATIKAQGYMLRQAALQWLEPPTLDILQSAWRLTPSSDAESKKMHEILKKASQYLED